ncbi:hypothetical protein DWT25_09430, partial [Campylobacter coli]|nr:hypothetical protein [Campylobacter coli]
IEKFEYYKALSKDYKDYFIYDDSLAFIQNSMVNLEKSKHKILQNAIQSNFTNPILLVVFLLHFFMTFKKMSILLVFEEQKEL